MYGEITSTPITSALRTAPVRTIAEAADRPYRKLVQAVFTSIDAALTAPSLTCTPEALFGTCSSKVQLPCTIRSRSAASRPAQASARRLATVARSMPGTCETRRSFMPVRVTIHSSLVSRKVDKSSLDRTAGGMHLPQPVIAA